jgi:hypothetical protein
MKVLYCLACSFPFVDTYIKPLSALCPEQFLDFS